MIYVRGLALAMMLAIGCSSEPKEATCSSDSDCDADRACRDGACVIVVNNLSNVTNNQPNNTSVQNNTTAQNSSTQNNSATQNNETCVPTNPQFEVRCVDDSTYYFDDCELQGAKVEDCEFSCDSGACQPCVPDCSTATCGLDPVCGQMSCGTCAGDDYCNLGTCEPAPIVVRIYRDDTLINEIVGAPASGLTFDTGTGQYQANAMLDDDDDDTNNDSVIVSPLARDPGGTFNLTGSCMLAPTGPGSAAIGPDDWAINLLVRLENPAYHSADWTGSTLAANNVCNRNPSYDTSEVSIDYEEVSANRVAGSGHTVFEGVDARLGEAYRVEWEVDLPVGN